MSEEPTQVKPEEDREEHISSMGPGDIPESEQNDV